MHNFCPQFLWGKKWRRKEDRINVTNCLCNYSFELEAEADQWNGEVWLRQHNNNNEINQIFSHQLNSEFDKCFSEENMN